MIQHDYISEIFIVLAVSIFLYLFTIVGTAVVLFPVILLLSGMALHNFVKRRRQKGSEEEDFDDTEITNEHLWKNLIFDTVVALFGVFLINEALNLHPLAVSSGLTGFYAFLFEVLIGIAEEEFFRGFATDWFLTSLKTRWYPFDAIALGGGFFTVYHFAVYGTVFSNLLYVFGGDVFFHGPLITVATFPHVWRDTCSTTLERTFRKTRRFRLPSRNQHG